MAVLPRAQRRGAGSRLARAGLALATELGYDFVVVLGAPDYYRRFGFATASCFGLANDYGADEPFMALALHADGLRDASGLVSYQPEFAFVASQARVTAG